MICGVPFPYRLHLSTSMNPLNPPPSKRRSLSRSLETMLSTFSSFEKALFYGLGILLIISTLGLAYSANESLKVTVPSRGGSLIEGIIGVPHFVNPLFSVSDAEKDLSSLIYSGLMKVGPNGTLVPDLAESYTVSPDQKTYTFKLRDSISFHDNELVTAQDVAFTIKTALDPALKSPRRAQWEGVTIDIMSPREVRFTLPAPYPAFLENTTLGIIPQHVWKSLPAEQIALGGAIAPVGSGPYKVASIDSKTAALPIRYNLTSFSHYALGEPLIPKITLAFFTTEDDAIDALKKGEIESLANITPAARARLSGIAEDQVDTATATSTNPAAIHTLNTHLTADVSATLPRVFGVFFNQNQSTVLRDKDIRSALEMATDHNAIIEKVLLGAGTPIDLPLLPQFVPEGVERDNILSTSTTLTISTASTTVVKGKKKAITLTSSVVVPRTEFGSANAVNVANQKLEKAGWTLNQEGVREKKINSKESLKLSFSLTTVNSPDLIATANLLKDQWERLGAKVKIEIFEQGDFNQTVLRPRKYDAVLFGQIVGRDADLYPFWHSSQRNDPGLNIAMYANSKADKALEEARTASDMHARAEALATALSEISHDIPALFLYAPHFVYIVPSDIHGISTNGITRPSERFASIKDWYRLTEKVWNVKPFTKGKPILEE